MTQRNADQPLAVVQAEAGKGWLLLAITAMGLSTLFAVVLVVSRVPALAQWTLVDQMFRLALVLHVDFAIGLWFMAVAGFLWARSLGGRAGLFSQGLAFAGMLLMLGSVLTNEPKVLLSDYLPVLDNSGYLLGLALFCSGWLMLALRVLINRLQNVAVKNFPAEGAVIIPLTALLSLLAVVTLLLGFAQLPTGGWQAGFASLVWGPGHLLQSVHTLLVLLAWAWLCQLAGVTVRLSCLVRKVMILLAALPAIAGALILPWLEFGSKAQHLGYTLVMALGGSIAFAMLLAGVFRSTLTAPANPYRTLLGFSLLLFAAGTCLGFFIRENTSLVPAHYHGVIGAVTLAFMGLIYHLLPTYGAESVSARMIRWQARIYGGGLLLLIGGLVLSDMPRKISGAQMQMEGWPGSAGVLLMALGGTAALTGSFWFVFLAVKSLLVKRGIDPLPEVVRQAQC